MAFAFWREKTAVSVNVIQYFNNRCPAMVEKECMELTGEEHKFSTWPNGFEEVSTRNI